MNYINILFLDIETVGMVSEYDELDERWRELWKGKAAYMLKQDPEMTAEQAYGQRAAIFSEFGRVVCISFGFLLELDDSGTLAFRVKSIAGADEEAVLTGFAQFVDSNVAENKRPFKALCGHNIREFDIPYLCRRMIKHGVKLPEAFQLHGKKPWEVKHLIDTMELWKFGDYKHFTSLDLLSAHLDIPTPKDDMHGSMVHSAFYDDDDIDRIRNYCEKDVVTTARVYLKMMHQKDFDPEHVEFVSD